MSQVRISMTTFNDFVAASSMTKLTQVRNAKRIYDAPNEDFKLQDYYLALRLGIGKCLEADGDRRALDDVLSHVHDGKKVANYVACVDGLKRWIGRKTIEWMGCPRRPWSSGDLVVSVNPEAGLRIGGVAHVIKLHLKAPVLSQRAADPMLRLLEITHGRQGQVGILDVRRSRLIVPTKSLAGLDPLLAGEAASFVTMWEQVSVA